MSWGYVAIAAATVVSAVIKSKSAKDAAEEQKEGSDQGINEQRRQFDKVQELLAPYVGAGTAAVGGQMSLLGLAGQGAQKEAIASIANSPQMQALVKQGENSILQNAAATGGLRGGNTQAVMAEFRPSMLSRLIDQQYSRLGQMAMLGQQAAGSQAQMGQQTSANITDLMAAKAAAGAGGTLAQGQASSEGIMGIGKVMGSIF